MLGVSGEVKVADFGLARVEKGGESVNLTQIGVTMGTPLYMSPEQVEGKPVDVRSDIYSFGHHLLSHAGRPPAVRGRYAAEDRDPAPAERAATAGGSAQRLAANGLCRIVHKMIAKRPQDRYQNATELLRDLRTVQIEGADESWAAGIGGLESARDRCAVRQSERSDATTGSRHRSAVASAMETVWGCLRLP
jgi:eukaryotic-like serine/threonine-protein kinase